MAEVKEKSTELLGKRSLRSHLREAFGALSEFALFENKYYDLFRTPLDTFQEQFPEDSRGGWLYSEPSKNIHDKEGAEWVDYIQEDLYNLWRTAGAPSIYTHEASGSYTTPREFAFDSSKIGQALGYLFGAPEMVLGTDIAHPVAGEFIEESAHQIMFENPELFGFGSRQDLIKDKLEESKEWSEMTTEERWDKYYTNPGIQTTGKQSQEYVAHSTVAPKIIEWLKEQ